MLDNRNFLYAILIVALFLICAICLKELFKDTNSTPIKDEIVIDSISKENKKLIIEVNNLDSIKDAKIIEVKSLDNDSTLKLFYELIRK